MRKSILATLIALSACACQSEKKIPGFDSASWKSDKKGCDGIRLQQADSLIKYRNEVKGMTVDQVQKVMGLPNSSELIRRDQQYYIYTLSPAKTCPNFKKGGKKLSLRLRFNSIGTVNELTITSR
ncbi:hypothetical protein FUAX_21150 [Fulvitalea axinellae]|uniref:Outer membrane protein assembly factor BamE domain-containing protein n=1 Tax=Fulvitalea axinellae TaxID=1182444 RepID=A0AAU9D198_9BACT|nr:hypothetical protein FUAX_21150 [Fulvitalea axinellae]